MTKEERGLLYDKVYDEFIELINGKRDKVVISEYELMELDARSYWHDTDGVVSYGIVTHNNYVDVLKEHFGKFVIQEKDLIGNNYIFRLSNERKK